MHCIQENKERDMKRQSDRIGIGMKIRKKQNSIPHFKICILVLILIPLTGRAARGPLSRTKPKIIEGYSFRCEHKIFSSNFEEGPCCHEAAPRLYCG